jgi:hypothetical protein
MKKLMTQKKEWLVILSKLRDQAIKFWHCAPFDRFASDDGSAMLWKKHQPGEPMDEGICSNIKSFCADLSIIVKKSIPVYCYNWRKKKSKSASRRRI